MACAAGGPALLQDCASSKFISTIILSGVAVDIMLERFTCSISRVSSSTSSNSFFSIVDSGVKNETRKTGTDSDCHLWACIDVQADEIESNTVRASKVMLCFMVFCLDARCQAISLAQRVGHQTVFLQTQIPTVYLGRLQIQTFLRREWKRCFL
jgi:hypothetical protein